MNELLLGTFAIDPQLRRAVELWADYYERTELFDRTVCHARSPRTGNAIPISRDEQQLCSRNARNVMRQIERHKATEAISSKAWRDAQRIALDHAERR